MPYADRQKQLDYLSRFNLKHSAQRREERHAEVRRLIREAKEKPCADCGHSYPHYVMDLDRRPGVVKLGCLGNAISKNWTPKRVREELDKCDAVCSNCHRERTHQRTEGVAAQAA